MLFQVMICSNNFKWNDQSKGIQLDLVNQTEAGPDVHVGYIRLMKKTTYVSSEFKLKISIS